MSTYAATQVGAYLKERFGFTFTDEPVLQRLEDHLWEAGRRAQTQRKEVVRIAEGLKEDIGYVLHSALKPDSGVYEPNSRGDFAAGVRHLGELESAVQDLVGVHQATLWALRAHLSNVPTLEEHTSALGELRHVRAERDKALHDVNELLAAREQYERDEQSAQARLDTVAAERDSYAARLKATDRATTERIADLERKLEAERQAAATFHDERDAEAEYVQRYRAEVERLEGLHEADSRTIEALEQERDSLAAQLGNNRA
jgi:chromosome segregation ATPase